MHDAARVDMALVGIDLADDLVLVFRNDSYPEMPGHSGARPGGFHSAPCRGWQPLY